MQKSSLTLLRSKMCQIVCILKNYREHKSTYKHLPETDRSFCKSTNATRKRMEEVFLAWIFEPAYFNALWEETDNKKMKRRIFSLICCLFQMVCLRLCHICKLVRIFKSKSFWQIWRNIDLWKSSNELIGSSSSSIESVGS